MSGHESPADINSLQEALAQQQQKITALREMVRKSDSSRGKPSSSRTSTTEKVKNITKQLTKLKAKARGAFYSGETSVTSSDLEEPELSYVSTTPMKSQQQQQLSTTIEGERTPTIMSSTGSEKVQLLRQQMEQNKLRLAQRASSKLHLEQMVSDLKEKLDSTQQSLDDTTQVVGKSMTDLSESLQYTTPAPSSSVVVTRREQRHRSATDLSTQPAFNLEKERIKFLENRCRLLEKQLEKEKQQGSAGKHVEGDLVEEQKTRRQLEQRAEELQKQLEKARENLEERPEHPKDEELQKRLLELERLLHEKDEQIQAMTIKEQELCSENARLRAEIERNLKKDEEEEESDNQFELIELRNENNRMSKRIAELEDVNDVLETTRSDLEASNNVYKERVEQLEEELRKAMAEIADRSKKPSEETAKHLTVDDTESQVETEMAKQIQELQDRNEQLDSENDKLKEAIASHEKVEIDDEQITSKISNLEATIESQREELTARQTAIKKLEEELMEKTIELNVLNANFRVMEEKLQALSKSKSKPLFSSTAMGDGNPESDAEIQQLKQKLDESNKAMIKLKLKCKQSEKQIEKLKKTSNLHEELVKLQKANEQLQQRITELEDEKGQWQLTQIKDESNTTTSEDKDNINNRSQLETTTTTIRLLEEQKFEQTQQIEKLRTELETLKKQTQSQERVVVARVESELSEIHLEEKFEELKDEMKTLQQQLDEKDAVNNTLHQENETLKADKEGLEKKLEHYLNENMELLDKVEKLSKSSSSAESIEIVDRLTQQEHAEMVEMNKRFVSRDTASSNAAAAHPKSVSEVTQTEMGSELSESLVKLREESSELMTKVEMFTSERREVLEKMENLTTENHELVERVEELTQQKTDLENQILAADEMKMKLESELQALAKEKEALTSQVAESTAQKAQLSRELTSMQKSSEIVAALDNSEGSLTLFGKCEKSLSKLDTELEAYRRANDRNAKFNASKKLAKEAKNAHTQLTELLLKVKEASTAVETVTVVETVVAVTASNGKALAEYEQLTAQNRELKTTVDALRYKLQELEDASSSRDETISELVEVKPTDEAAAAKPNDNKKAEQYAKQAEQQLNQSLEKLKAYEEECVTLKATVDGLREQLTAVNLANEVKTGEITRLKNDMKELQRISKEFENMLNDKEAAHAQQVEQFTRIRKELEGKCEVYAGEMEILQTLVTEQKQQLIEVYKEHEHEMNLKLLDLQQRDEQITKLRTELTDLRQASRAAGAELSSNLEEECEKLRECLRINKALTAEQINELVNKQETIDMLNQQLIELYKTMEENTNKVIEKEDEIAELRTIISKNKLEYERLHKDNEEEKAVVDKLLNELHSHKEDKQQIIQLEMEVQTLKEAKAALEQSNKDLEKRCKDQLEKMKKYAANLKKRAAQCQEFEAKIQAFESKMNDGELQQELSANVVLLNERISDYELKIKNQEEHLYEIQEALQAKTIEILESMENNEKLEQDMQSLQKELQQRDEDIIQLKNALAASQEQMPPTSNDWGDVSNSGELANSELLEKVQSELLEVREILMNKNQAIEELTVERQEREQSALAIENIMQEQIAALQGQVQEYKSKVESAENQLQQQQQQLQKVSEELSAKSLKFEKSKAVIKERNNQIQRLQAQLKEMQDKLTQQPEEEEAEQQQPPEIRKQVTTTLVTAPPPPTTVEAVGLASNTVPKSDFEGLQHAFDNLSAKYANEKQAFEQTIARLETLHDGIQAKLQEDMAYIESLEQENTSYKEKICKLEECVGTFEERRASMERRAHFLDAQMQTRTDEYVKAEDELIYRLNMLSEHDEVIAQRLMDSQEEKEKLQELLDKAHQEFSELSAQHNKLEKEYNQYKEQSESQMETELQTLRQKLEANESERMQRMRSTYDAKMAAKTKEIDELENDLSDQLARMNQEKRDLQENLEKSRDECNALKDEVMRLNESLNAADQAKQESERELSWLRMEHENAEQDQDELHEMRMQSMQDKTEIDNLRQQIETLASNHQSEISALRMQIAELDSLRMQVGQNQTDDQVFIESENKRLSDLLTEKEAIIAEYQRQNLQLQRAAAAAARSPQHQSQPQSQQPQQSQQPPDLFASIGSEAAAVSPQQATNATLLEQELAEKNALIRRLQLELDSLRERGRGESREGGRQIGDIGASSNAAPSNDIIPAPPMFFASSQATSSPFDEIVQRRHEQPQYAAAAAAVNSFLPDSLDQPPTIEDLQRNVSDLEKYAQDLENKLAARNVQEEEVRQRMNEAHARQLHAENELKRLEEQLQLANQRLQEQEQTQSQLEARIVELEALLKERDDQLCSATTDALVNAQDSAQHTADIQNRLQAAESILEARENDVRNLKEQLDATLNLTSNLEAQIISTIDAAKENEKFKRDVAPSLDMFFGNTQATQEPNVFEDIIIPPQIPQVSDVPVVEEVIVPEKAYQCYPQDGDVMPKPSGGGTDFNLDFGDDVWGGNDDAHWGDNEAAAEAQHFAQTQSAAAQSTSLLSREQQLELELQASAERIKELQNTLQDSEAQKQKLQEKLAKSLKVVSKYKSQNEELKKSNTGSSTQANFFDDLDVAIQDELRQQVAKLETELAEQRKQQKEATIEKDKLLKRIDVLTAGNERMAEMKERQDMDMDMYKMRISELQQKLNKLEEWGGTTEEVGGGGGGSGAAAAPKNETSIIAEGDKAHAMNDGETQELVARIETLLAEIDDLNGDKQELQALLDEERANQSSHTDERQRQFAKMSEDFEDVCKELETLKAQNVTLEEARQQLQKELDDVKRCLEAARFEAGRCDDLKQVCMELEKKLQSEEALHFKQNAMLEVRCQELKEEIEKLRAESLKASEAKSEMASGADAEASNSANFDELSAQLQEKDAEIVHLKQRIEDLMREDQTEKLVLEILTKNQEIHMLKMQVKNLEEDKQELEHNLTMQITKEMKRQQQKADERSGDEEDTLKRVTELTKQLEELQAEKHQMEEELNVLNAHVLSSLELEDKLKKAALDLDTKDIEIKELRKSLDSLRENNKASKSSAEVPAPPQAPEVDVAALNAGWETLVEQRCSEIAEMWRLHLEQREAEFKAIELRLKTEIDALQQKAQQQAAAVAALPTSQQQQQQQNVSRDTSAAGSAGSSTPVSTASATSPSASADSSSAEASKDCTPLHIINEADADELISKMQAALESQEMEIVSLKEQLAIRSAEYARLAAQYDPFKLQSGSSFDSPRSLIPQRPQNNESSAPVVPKSELDLAMYMLHQRDMRIEEMTVELVALLEERDTLQLKLSNTLRQMEAIKVQRTDLEPLPTQSETMSAGSTAADATASTDSPSKSVTSSERDDSNDELSQKLSQLQTVKHSRDKLIQEERENRTRQMEHIRQIERIQQDVAKIPTAAVSELIGADISQSNHSPSSALLNWLWGNKFPGSDSGGAANN